jgi:hypothetical protein
LRRRTSGSEPIEVCNQAIEQGDELRGLIVREAIERFTVALEQGGTGIGQSGKRNICQGNAAAARKPPAQNSPARPAPL